ncbi:Cas10/Cmr2 second palm domain-containing protein [Thermoanaerobacterium thermosaccharolyticum]|uniref:Cas10/Cmr2 second palm domain-containing protein n=1 Tax=Thermoanaerobacterium thermosaccharolyticum TaxID=1517 RepID=UPI00177C852A|nr:haloacid dehalogenase [Thermoanaerobacterium thermosaccharolyticum]MBE0069100.1 haloacid dehalogenase [Thermoanaerobacterium thermosaccharolyticum]MBE0228923.1 haloacid dehalogenase [Thermoanaerobacterium thermosaccharolyticum]
MYIDYTNEEKNYERLPNGYVSWVDAVTGTNYCMALDDYEKKFKKIVDDISIMGSDEIYEYLKNDVDEIPYIRPYKDKKDVKAPSLKDAATLAVCFAYAMDNSNDVRLEMYHHFFEIEKSQRESINTALKMVDMLALGEKFEDSVRNADIKIVKGGVYKTKKYIVENNDIKCLRGSSYLLDNINRVRIPGYFKEKFIPESIIYCGGGNVFAVVPDNDIDIDYDLERLYEDVTITAQSAFISYKTTLKDLINDYKEVISDCEEMLEDRKKLKLYLNVDPNYGDINKGIEDKDMVINEITHKQIESKSKLICKFCNLRDAHYTIQTSEGEKGVCLSCLHKIEAGTYAKSGFHEEFQRMHLKRFGQGQYGGKKVQGLDEIGAFKNNGYMALIYGDGNNFGNIIKNIKNVYEMMYFSRKAESSAFKATLEAIRKGYEAEGEEIPFEVIELGGDDIFIITPAKSSLIMASKLIETFDKEFQNKSDINKSTNVTMSIGVAISKYSTPIRNMFELANKLLKKAKSYSKKMDNKIGTVSFAVLESNMYLELDRDKGSNYDFIHQGILNYTWIDMTKLINLVLKMKESKKMMKNHIYKLRDAASMMLPLEFKLFYMYDKSKTNIEDIEKGLVEIANGCFDEGLFRFSGENGTEYHSPWYDITEIWDYV